MREGGAAARDVVIAGAGNAARILLDCLDGDERWRPVAFIADDEAGSCIGGLPVLHPEEEAAGRCRRAFMAVAAPASRRRFVERLAHLDLAFETFVDRRSYVSRDALIGLGGFVQPFATVAAGARIGDFSYVGLYAAVGTLAVLGDYATLSPRSSVGACTLGNDCAVGFNSACLGGAVLGDEVVLAPYTWVRKPVPDGSFVAGSPPRVTLRART